MEPELLPDLGAVEETMLIPLYGRALESRDPEGILHDPLAVEMVERIDYDFARFDGGPSLFGACLRTVLIDHWVRRFLDAHPDGTVIEVGAGLNTRFERVDNGRLHWVDLDLPGAIALRRRFIPDGTGRRTTLAASVLESGWAEEVAQRPGPWFFAVEGVLPYLAPEEVSETVARLAGRFPGSWFATETVAASVIGNQQDHDVMSRVTARMHWACDDPRIIEQWAPPGRAVRLRESLTLAQLPPELLAGFSAARQEAVRAAAVTYAEQLETFRVNLFQVVGAD
ncbi:class I SAM-dependent methyltransferase [Streptomyces sp. ACA25]|uniref:class I SAM-dependent methyltransferase n=1 Tax=Streptomyces sp. ACA25 TaxID=3022596 RepID=UPI0023076F12|nr:class I SAM-dependent methyltransferase [Streptomyces sp. ACA25]MDB1089680.1 class I SAM-dependent methyltransferase [Streptomyces sp. ACA25]